MERSYVWSWERRQRLLLMVTMVYAFLLGFLVQELTKVREHMLRRRCDRTGTRLTSPPTPLYRLHSALNRRWLAHLTNMSPTFGMTHGNCSLWYTMSTRTILRRAQVLCAPHAYHM